MGFEPVLIEPSEVQTPKPAIDELAIVMCHVGSTVAILILAGAPLCIFVGGRDDLADRRALRA